MRQLYLLALALTLALAGCTTTRPSAYPVDMQGPYRLDTGDVVRVTVYGDAELSKSYQVDDSGAVAFPLVGRVPVRGGTTDDAANRLSRALANGYMRNPNVVVEVEQYRPFFIQGEISNAGQFPYVYGMTVRAAISTAGGYTETADRNRVMIYRRKGAEMVQGPVNLDFPIAPGDTVVVPERWF